MARRTFFSFHYKPDVNRAQIVRNSWLTKPDREDAGFFDSSVFESKQRVGNETLKSFLIDGLKNTSVTCVLVGSETYLRPWVRFEIFRSFYRGNGLLAVDISSVSSFGTTGLQGPNPFESLAFTVKDERVFWKQKVGADWKKYTDVPSLNLSEVSYSLGDLTNHTFSCLFPIYDWKSDKGYDNLGLWIEKSAKQAGR